MATTPPLNLAPSEQENMRALGYTPPTPPKPPEVPGTGATGYRNPALRAESPMTLPGGLALEEAPDREKIREQKLKVAQAQIDNINREYDVKENLTREEANAQNARTRALNISAGLPGSDFASTFAGETEKKGRRALEAVAGERAAKISAILADAEDKASTAYREQRSAFLQEATTANTYRKEQVADARNTVKLLAENGADLAKFRAGEPEVFKSLMERGGFESELEFDSLFETSKRKGEQVDYKDVYVAGSTPGTTTLIRYGINPQTKELSEKRYELNIPYSKLSDPKTEREIIKGRIYERQSNGDWKAVGGPGETPGVADTKKAAIEKARGTVTGSVGTDGYADPTVYMRERGAYASSVGSASGFDEVFAPMLSPQHRARLGIGKAVGETATGEDDGVKFISGDYLRNLFPPDALSKSSEEAGYGDTDEYLAYLLGVVEQYRAAGYTDREILKLMQQ